MHHGVMAWPRICMADLASTIKAMWRTVHSGAGPQDWSGNAWRPRSLASARRMPRPEKFVWFQNPVPIEQNQPSIIIVLFVPFNIKPHVVRYASRHSDSARVDGVSVLSMGLSEWIVNSPTWMPMQPAQPANGLRFIYPTSTSVPRARKKLAPAGFGLETDGVATKGLTFWACAG